MNAESTAPSKAEIVDELSKWTVGLGIVTLALFSLAVPILVLTAVATIPLLLPFLAVGLLVGGVALMVLVIRGLGRLAMWVLRRGGAGPEKQPSERTAGPRWTRDRNAGSSRGSSRASPGW
jgi:hypothetical protein